MTNQEILKNVILDCLYRMVCQKKSNTEIFREMERKSMPPMDNEQLETLRQEFAEKEKKYPQKMAAFRQRLGV